MGEQSPSFQLYPRDLLADTSMLSDAAFGLYVRLLCAQWREGSLPAAFESEDGEAMTELIPRDDPKVRRRSWKAIARHFKPHPSMPGRVVNERLERERQKQSRRRADQAASGAAGADGKWGSQDHHATRADGSRGSRARAAHLTSGLRVPSESARACSVLPMPSHDRERCRGLRPCCGPDQGVSAEGVCGMIGPSSWCESIRTPIWPSTMPMCSSNGNTKPSGKCNAGWVTLRSTGAKNGGLQRPEAAS